MFNKYNNKTKKDGVILLFVVIILTAIFSISIGVFGVILSQVNTSGTFESSYRAVYAADQAIERALYRDRQQNDFACSQFPCPQIHITDVSVTSGGCSTNVTIDKTNNLSPPPATTTQITATGLSTPCPPAPITERTTARAFLTTY